MFQLGEPGLHAHSQSCKTHLTHWQESEEGVGHSRSATYEPSRCERSVMRACIWFQQGTRTCAISVRPEWNCSLPSVSCCWWSFNSTISHLLSFLQPVALFAVHSVPIPVCCCTVPLYFSRYCPVVVKMVFCVYFSYIVWNYYKPIATVLYSQLC